MTSRKPPSQRDAENVTRQHDRTLMSMAPGTARGRLASAQPLPAGTTFEDADSDTGDDASDSVLAWNDSFTVSATGTQTLDLTWLPLDNSEHFYWHPAAGAGIYWDESEWSRDGQTITVLDPDGILEVGDKITVEYLYLDGADTDDLVFPVTLPLLGDTYGCDHFAEDHTPSVVGWPGADIWADNNSSTYIQIYRENAFTDYAWVRTAISDAPVDFPTLAEQVDSVVVYASLTEQGGSPAIIGTHALLQSASGSITWGSGEWTGDMGDVVIPIVWGQYTDPEPDLQSWLDAVNTDGRYQMTFDVISEVGSFPHFSKWMRVLEAHVEVRLK